MGKKEWVRPVLTVLIRDVSAGESILASCKNNDNYISGAGPKNKFNTCGMTVPRCDKNCNEQGSSLNSFPIMYWDHGNIPCTMDDYDQCGGGCYCQTCSCSAWAKS